MNEKELQERTRKLALRVIKLVKSLPRSLEGRTIANQIIRSGTSIAANYRAACRARSKAEFISKLGIVEEETDETAFWLEITIETKLLRKELVDPLLNETNEILAIMVASRKSAARNSQSQIANRKSKM